MNSVRHYVALLGLMACIPVLCDAGDGITVQADPDFATGVVVLRLTNTSGKQISAFNVSVTASYSDGSKRTGERMVDLLPRILSTTERTASNEPALMGGFSAGESMDETTSFPPLIGSAKLVSVAAKVDVEIFVDNTAAVQNDDAFTRILDFRQESANASEEALKVIQKHLARTGNAADAAGASALEIRQKLIPRAKATPGSVLEMQLSMIADDLARFATVKPNSSNSPLHDYVNRRQRRASRMADGARIERKR